MDDSDKIRRNLVVTSTVVIAIAYLDVPVPLLLDRIFSLKADPAFEIKAWKLWLMILVILSYFAWRYRWSDDFTKGLEDHYKAMTARYLFLVQSSYIPQVVEWTKSGVFPGDVHPKLAMFMEHGIGGAIGSNVPKPVDVSLFVSGMHHSSESGDVQITSVWPNMMVTPGPNDLDTPTVARSNMTQLYIDDARRLLLKQRAGNYAHFNSKASMALLWPLGLGAIAGCIVLFRLVRSGVAGQ